MAVERIALAEPIETRDGTLGKDSRTVNAVFESGDGKGKDFVKRPGLLYETQVAPVSPPSTLNSQGLVSFNNNLVAVISNTLYGINASTNAVSTIAGLSYTTNKAYFSKTTLDSTLVFHNTVNVYTYTSAGVFGTATLPVSGPYVPGAVFLDNYTFIGCATNNRIYNSDLGNPSSWNALNYITFEQTADTLVGICKHLNYIVAFGKSSMQFYYDAANATGSPLAVAQTYTLETGCAQGDSIVSTDNTVLWVGATKTHGKSVYLLDGVSPIKVSTASIDKALEADGLAKVTAFAYKFWGHSLYIITLHTTGVTLVYDINEKIWNQWTQYALASSDQPNAGTYQESYFRGVYYAEAAGTPFVLDDDTATLYSLDNNTYMDNGQPIYCRSVTEIKDNGTTQRKFYSRLEIIGDKAVGGVMQVRHTGDDYNTWSTFRSIDLGASRPQIYLSGSDRRRAWEFLCTSNVPLRLECAELEFRIGEMDQEQSMGRRR
jgi:hypothetical protein